MSRVALERIKSYVIYILCNPICSNDCGVVFFVKIYFSFREIIFFVRLPLASITTGE